MKLLILFILLLLLSPQAHAMLFPDLRICNFAKTSVAYQVIGLEAKPTECSSWRRLDADTPIQCQTIKLFDGPCQNSSMDSVRVVFDTDRNGRCVIPMIKVTSPGKIDVGVERQDPDQIPKGTYRSPLVCRWNYQ